ncbi:ATP-dependent Clp protease proteolytic subunit ClpP [Comamonas sp. BIGb0124]|uniref:ClpP-like prohead protease/major capsid protein fusion protein n=1 Tax=Comamonas sp. BIGb0124 TaxID=2485130 RepID=UPI000F490837|nr:ClpP-like prohead protease/major capsid protein fusion protein [Comamonas sp. BIGb0124]ROR25155.1 ATP-dependent Clp protease proteolytic subunit ClpP [Comamonas sp. BIGb0124]
MSWFRINRKAPMAAAAAGVIAAATIHIYGDIGESWWDETVSARGFVAELNELDVTEIDVRINSLGGSVPDGLAIYNAMRRHKANITVHVDGIAYSIASLIAMGGDKVRMASNALMMIHAPWTVAAGNSAELREMADQLDTWATAMSTSYAKRTGDQPAALALLTDGKDHFFTATEALELRLIDEIGDEVAPIEASVRGLDLSRFRSLPAALAQSNPPAAPAAQPQGSQMTTKTNPPAAGAQPGATAAPGQPAPAAGGGTAPDAAAQTAIFAADRQRRTDIRSSFSFFASHEGVDALRQACEDDHTVTVEAAGARLLAHLGSQAAPIAGARRVTTVEDEADKRRTGVVASLLVRAGYGSKEDRANHGANPWRGMTLLELARASLRSSGLSERSMDKRDLVSAAFTHSTSDFPVLLADVVHRTLQSAYATQALTWRRFCKVGQVSDFREHKRIRIGSLGNLQEKNELGEYKSIPLPDGETASVSAGTKGYIIGLSREIIINDDLGAITDQSAAMGRSAARTVESDVYATLALNNGLGPVLADGKTLFHDDHKNVAQAAAITTESAHAYRVLMSKHKDISGNDFLDIAPAIWLGPIGLEAQAKLINQAQYEPSTNKNSQTPNISLGLFRDIVGTPRLAGTRQYVFADPQTAPVLEVSFLDGIDTPFIELETAFNTDGARWKVRLDYGVDAVDYRGTATNAGQ